MVLWRNTLVLVLSAAMALFVSWNWVTRSFADVDNLQLPPGFSVNVFAELSPAGQRMFRGPRFMVFSPQGVMYLSLGGDNKVVRLPDDNHDGVADRVEVVADHLNAPQGLTFVGNTLYIAEQDKIVKWDQGKAIPVITDLPTGGHTFKSVRLGPDGFLYVNVGSSCNVCEEKDSRRATLLRYTVDGVPAGKQGAVWATGLRNTQGWAWQPGTQAMYATNEGSDNRSPTAGGEVEDELPPEHLNVIEGGGFYGWPHCWGNRVVDPNFPGECRSMIPPVMTFPSHSTPIGISFLQTAKVPEEYQNDALVALHGSWNRKQLSGYKVVRVHFEEGKPVSVSDFMTGWLHGNNAWGRPVDIVVGPDRAIYLSDDRAGKVYRIRYLGDIK